jgi:hypothetical protein
MNTKTMTLTLVLALPASLTLAQRPGGGGRPPGLPPGPPQIQPREVEPRGTRLPNRERERREREPREKPPFPGQPLVRVLDADHDGIISAGEIEVAPDALLTLDKNKDGKLTPNEFLAPRPDGPPPGETERPPKREAGDKEREWPFPNRKPPGDAEKPLRAAGDNGGERPGQKPPVDRERKPERDGDRERPRPPVPPLIAALNADGDREISADEIANSPKALLTLDKNGDGQLGPREFLAPPPGPRPDGDGPKPPLPPEEAE